MTRTVRSLIEQLTQEANKSDKGLDADVMIDAGDFTIGVNDVTFADENNSDYAPEQRGAVLIGYVLP